MGGGDKNTPAGIGLRDPDPGSCRSVGRACCLPRPPDFGAVWWAVTLTRRYRVEGSLCSILASNAPAPQERLEAARQALSEARKQSSSLSEQVQTMRGELADLEVQRAEAGGQLQQLQEVRATMGPFCPRDAEALRMQRDLP